MEQHAKAPSVTKLQASGDSAPISGLRSSLLLRSHGTLAWAIAFLRPFRPDIVTEEDAVMSEAIGLVTLQSAHSVEETIARARAMLEEKGIREFALIDHSGEAAKVGLTMPK